MRCESARDALLEADREVLSGRADGPLAEHVRSCPRCARVATRLLEAEAALAGGLAREAREPSAEAVEATLRRARRAPRGSLSRWTRRAWAPALAAAALATLLPWPDGGPPPAPSASPASVPTLPVVEAPPGRDLAVVRTSNPSITVVWFFGGTSP